jgi:MtN3 and saliva related transmembrane protein
MEDQELTQPRGSAAFFGRAIVRELRAVSGSPAEAGGSYFVMGQSNRITLVVLFPSLITLYGCQDLVPRDTQSLFFPGLQRSEIFGFLAGFGTTFAGVPDLVSMLKRRSRAGMYPMMAAIMGTFQILWVYYGILIASRPVIAWNVVAVLINFLTVGAYGYYGHKEKSK